MTPKESGGEIKASGPAHRNAQVLRSRNDAPPQRAAVTPG